MQLGDVVLGISAALQWVFAIVFGWVSFIEKDFDSINIACFAISVLSLIVYIIYNGR